MDGFDRAMSATTNTTLLGSVPAVVVIASAQRAASLRSLQSSITRAATRRRFSISARRNMIGTAHSSPSLSGAMVW